MKNKKYWSWLLFAVIVLSWIQITQYNRPSPEIEVVGQITILAYDKEYQVKIYRELGRDRVFILSMKNEKIFLDDLKVIKK